MELEDMQYFEFTLPLINTIETTIETYRFNGWRLSTHFPTSDGRSPAFENIICPPCHELYKTEKHKYVHAKWVYKYTDHKNLYIYRVDIYDSAYELFLACKTMIDNYKDSKETDMKSSFIRTRAYNDLPSDFNERVYKEATTELMEDKYGKFALFSLLRQALEIDDELDDFKDFVNNSIPKTVTRHVVTDL